jgi:hypothetical protein
VDKTAGFVARNGAEFEHRIKQNEVNNPKFNFLNPGDPYHAYYQHRVVQIRYCCSLLRIRNVLSRIRNTTFVIISAT